MIPVSSAHFSVISRIYRETDYLKSNQYLKDLLKDIPFIIIKSYYRGKFDRFLCDIFYMKDELDPQVILEKGGFLNQKLLDKGLAKIFDWKS